jgi:cardiolipin synthase
MGSKPFLAGEQVGRLRSAGVRFTTALPTGLLRTLFARADLRNHRKIVVIDDRIAYTGSQNLVDPRFFKQDSGVGQWVDAMARITGPAAASLDGAFRLDWSVETGVAFEPPPVHEFARRPVHQPAHEPARQRAAPAPPGALVQVVPSGPGRRPEAIHQLLLTAIYSARHELVMTSPYFVPDVSMLTALLSAAARGVAVTLIVPARNDSLLVRHASAATYDDLVSAGARIALFNGGLLHTTSLTIDGETSVFGSVNLDMRSLWLNFEISLLVYDRDFTARLCALQDTYLSDSDLLDLDTWRRRPAWRRLAEDTCRLLGPLL